eukprot:TRINITY_DN98329_c0_g1_i1.p1 TRINITY_DN98329_c0_g1~~TRINITY_DN98329_c0_g1_i1.p1  ORF type:complete len:219 (-),score=45.51 TRINITY_DN98329_c0_g1_i1:153-743(-)
MAEVSGSTINTSGGQGSAAGVVNGARMAKLLVASERLVTCTVIDILKQDFKKAFAGALPPGADNNLSQAKTRVNATFSEAAHTAQAQAMKDHDAAGFIAQLEEVCAGEGVSKAPARSLVTPSEFPDPTTAIQEDVLRHERRAKIEMLRRHLEEQELACERQEQANAAMRAEVKALHEKLDIDTASLLAPLAPRAGA